MGTKNNLDVLIIDDEPDIRELLEITLARMNLSTKTASSVKEAKELLYLHQFCLCLTDMQLPDGNGIELVKLIQKDFPNLPTAVITAFGSMDTAIDSLKAGAFDFISKPIELKRLRSLVEYALKLDHKTNPETTNDSSQLLGQSKTITDIKKQIQKLARSQAPVYISGESGCGKELVARLIHQLGPRKSQPFIPVNCGAIPNELMESEFFGHKKGSFTGAINDKQGLFQVAHTGTLFLDEVADLPLHMQVKLLRAIQEKSIRPIGTQQEFEVDVRILSATHKNLEQQVNDGYFRQDLFYRINVIQLNVPPLREHCEDIDELAVFFLKRLATQWNITPPSLSSKAIAALKAYNFPGNVRELENILERALTLCEQDTISTEHLQLPKFDPATSSIQQATIDNNQHNITLGKDETLTEHLESIEKQMILHVLKETRWNRTAAAKKLGITFRSLRYRLKKLGFSDEEQAD